MIAIFDIGKTNKKCFVFDADYRIVLEKTAQLPETVDDDGDPCEDLDALRNWVLTTYQEILSDPRLPIRAVNVTTYGASLVHLDAEGRPLTPLYNYLKPFPPALHDQLFGEAYREEQKLSLETASPSLGLLNSGLQLYWLKYAKPLIFNRIKHTLHLPQYIASLLHGQCFSEMTSLGCHTLLWNFQLKDYHHWVKQEGLVEKFPPILTEAAVPVSNKTTTAQPIFGAGLHDSSAALLPYLACFDEPFVLISTGTWCISLNPFNHHTLLPGELAQDCLCYLQPDGKSVKAARYFGGQEHDEMVRSLAQAFHQPLDHYQHLKFDLSLIERFYQQAKAAGPGQHPFPDYATGYHVLMAQLMQHQRRSTKLVVTEQTRRLFVDGGFARNEVYMNLLAGAFPKLEVYAAEIAQSTALGAALVLHSRWNDKPLPTDLISLKRYVPPRHEPEL